MAGFGTPIDIYYNNAAVTIGTSSGTVAAGDDARIVDAAQKSANLSDLASASSARTNLGLGNSATKNVGTSAGTVAAGDDSRITGAAQKSSNLSDLANAGTARTNLGLGGAAVLSVGTTAGTVAAGDDSRITGAAQKSSNLSDLANAGTARTNLGLGGAAVLSVGTTAGTVAAGDDSRITGAAQKSSNLSDLANTTTARTNLGLGNSATKNVGTTAGTVAAGDDSRITGAAQVNRVTFSNANATVAATTAYLAQVGSMSAARTVTLPAASTVAAGGAIVIGDESGTVSNTLTLTVVTTGGDTINGAASDILGLAFIRRTYISNGSNAWTFGATSTSSTTVITSLNVESMFNPLNPIYGALGNGADDQNAVQACFTAALAANGTVYLPTLFQISRGVTIPTDGFKLPKITSVNTGNDTVTFDLSHGKLPGDPIMMQGMAPAGLKSGVVYFGNFSTSTTTSFYTDRTLAIASGSTGKVNLTGSVTTTASISSSSRNLAVAAELGVEVGTSLTVAGAGSSGGTLTAYVVGGVGTGTLVLNTAASTTVGPSAVVTYNCWIDWRYFDGGLKVVAAPGGGLKKHPTWNTSLHSGLLEINIGGNVHIRDCIFEGLSNMYVPQGTTGSITNGTNTLTITGSGDTSWAREGMQIGIGDYPTGVRIRSISGSTITLMANVTTSFTDAVIRGYITSGVIGLKGTGTSGTNTVTMDSVNGLCPNLNVSFDGISGTYGITAVNTSTKVITLGSNLSGSITSAILYFPGTSDAGDDGIRVASIHQATIENCIFRHCGDAAFREQTNVADYSAATASNPYGGVNTGEILFKHNYIFNCYQTSTTTNDFIHGGGATVWFEGNVFDRLNGSVKFANRVPGGRKIWLINNNIKSSYNHGFEIDSMSDMKIHGNILENIYNQGIFLLENGGAAGTLGLGIVGFAFDGADIDGNIFDNVGQGAGTACLRLVPDGYADGSQFDYPNVWFRNNVIKNCLNTTHIGVNVVNGSYINFRFENNDFWNCNTLDFLKMQTLRCSSTSGFVNAISIKNNRFRMNNASGTAIKIIGTAGGGVNQINEIDISGNLATGTGTRFLLLDNCANVQVKKNRVCFTAGTTPTWYLTNNDTVTNLTFEGNDFETSHTFGMSIGSVNGLYILNNRFKVNSVGGTSTASIANSCTDVWYLNNREINGAPNFRIVPVGTKALNSTLRQEDGTAVPSSGTWTAGSILKLTNATIGTTEWRCTVSGTLGSPSGSPTGTTDGTTNFVVVNSLADVAKGAWINLAGAWTGARQITDIDIATNTLTVSGAVPTLVTGAAITYVAPTFVRGAEIPYNWSTFNNANYSALTTDKVISQIGTLTAARAVTLPLAANVPAGYQIIIQDVSGTVTHANAVQTARQGSDTINGASTTRNIQTPYGREIYISDGVSNWTTPNISSTNGVTFSDAAYAATVTDRQILQIGTLTASRTVTLPLAANVQRGTQITISDDSGTCTAANTIVIARQGSDAIHTLASIYLSSAWASVVLQSNGSNRWDIVSFRVKGAVAKTANYTLTLSDSTVLADATSGNLSMQLPSAVNLNGVSFNIKKTDASANTVTITTTSAQTIDTASTVVISTQFQNVCVTSDGANWWIT